MGRAFTQPHRDAHTELHRPHLAVMTIDAQQDWIDPDALYGIAAAAQVTPALGRLVAAARRAAVPIVHAVRIYDGTESNADRCRRQDMADGKVHCAPGSAGTELVEDVRPDGYRGLDAGLLLDGRPQQLGEHEWVFYKPRFGAFSQPTLLAHLRGLGIDSLLVCGISFPRCVIATLLSAMDHDLRTGLVTDATSEIIPEQLAFLAGAGLQILDLDTAIDLVTGEAPPTTERTSPCAS